MYSAIFKIIRPAHWIKNVFLFAGLVFSMQLTNWSAVRSSFLGFISFCFLSSAVYIFNDICDRKKDRLHPKKRNRPLASGKLSVPLAIVLMSALGLTAIGIAVTLGWQFTMLCAVYIAINIAYSVFLKNKVIVDAMCIASGFVIRVIAGTIVVEVSPSSWLLICTFSLSLFLGFNKRRSELLLLGEDAGKTRFVNQTYTFNILDHMLNVTASIALVAFMLYTTAIETIENFGNNYILYTVPLVFYALFRFSAKVREGKVSGPVEMIVSDTPFQLTIIIWAIIVTLIIYL